MKNFMLGLLLLLSPLVTYGHNPLSARYFIEAGENISLLTINLSQDGVNQVLLKKQKVSSLAGLSRGELEQTIVDYVKSNFNLSLDGQKIELLEGGIKLGSHQTDLKFVLPPFPKVTKRLEIDIPAFKENDNHQTIFSYKIHERSDRVILSKSNDYRSSIILATDSSTNKYTWLSLGVVIFASLVFFMQEESFFQTLLFSIQSN